MALAPTTVQLNPVTYTCLNPSSPAVTAFSLYPIDAAIWFQVAATNAVPTNDSGALKIPPNSAGGGLINQTIGAIFPGSAAQYIHARMDRGSGSAVIACA